MHGHVVFVDESGDLGLSTGASETITLCGVSTGTRQQLERIPRRIRRRLIVRKLREKAELKFYNSTPRVREHALRSLASVEDVRVIALTVRKSCYSGSIEADPWGFYMSLCGALAGCLPLASSTSTRINLVFDVRRGRRSRGSDFDGRILAKACEGYSSIGRPTPDVSVSRLDSHNSGGLQMADFAAGAIHRWHESGDDHYRGIIDPVIVLDRLCGPR